VFQPTRLSARPARPLAALIGSALLAAGCTATPVQPSADRVALTLQDCLFRSDLIKDKLAPGSPRPLTMTAADGARVTGSCDVAVERLISMGAAKACVDIGRAHSHVGEAAERLFAAPGAADEASLKAAVVKADAAAAACPFTTART